MKSRLDLICYDYSMKNDVHMEGLSLTVSDVKHSVEYYSHLGFVLELDAAPQFALLRIGGSNGGTIGLLSVDIAEKEGASKISTSHAKGVHVELSTDNLDQLYADLLAKGIVIDVPPHDEPWERSMTAYDPDGYSVEFSEGRRGKL